jgi:hypothetical protein
MQRRALADWSSSKSRSLVSQFMCNLLSQHRFQSILSHKTQKQNEQQNTMIQEDNQKQRELIFDFCQNVSCVWVELLAGLLRIMHFLDKLTHLNQPKHPCQVQQTAQLDLHFSHENRNFGIDLASLKVPRARFEMCKARVRRTAMSDVGEISCQWSSESIFHKNWHMSAVRMTQGR